MNKKIEGCGHCASAAFFAPTNRDKSPVSALLGEVGYFTRFFVSRQIRRIWAGQVLP